MPSPVPPHLRTEQELAQLPLALRDHVVDLHPRPPVPLFDGASVSVPGPAHPAKYRPGQATALLGLVGAEDLVGDPMAGAGILAAESGRRCALNDLDPRMLLRLQQLAAATGGVATCGPAHAVPWTAAAVVFSPPYYPRTDRRRPAAHAAKRGAVVGFRDSYDHDDDDMIGNPSGRNGILLYRNAMRRVYRHLHVSVGARRMVVVVKNWTRQGVELRLDLDTLLTAAEAGWYPVRRHGWACGPSLWARFNAARGPGVQVEDVLVFDRCPPTHNHRSDP